LKSLSALIAGVGLEQNEKEEETGMERTGIVFQSIGINSMSMLVSK
jgi:hypothetical protein